jgi:hypothetical protein
MDAFRVSLSNSSFSFMKVKTASIKAANEIFQSKFIQVERTSQY